MAVLQLPMLVAWVRFPPPAPTFKLGYKIMFKLFKYSCKVFVAFCLLGTVFLIGIITLVDPNQFKSVIQKQVTAATGQTVAINGPLSWHITPFLSLEARDLSLALPTLSDNAFTLKTARFEPKLWSLFTGRLLVDIRLQGLEATVNHMPTFQINLNPASMRFLPYNITLEDSILHWKNSGKNQDLKFKNITLLAKKISLGAAGFKTPITVNFELEDTNRDHTGSFSFKAEWAFNYKVHTLDIQNIELNTNYPVLPFNTLLGKLQIQTQQNNAIEGSFQVPNLGLQYALSYFHLPVYPISAKTIDLTGTFKYQFPMLEVTAFNMALENEGSITGSFKTNLQQKNLKTLNLIGSFAGNNLKIGAFPISEFKTTLQAKDGLFIFDNIKAQLASSHHHAKIEIDIREDIPQITLADQINGFEINEVLARLGEKDKIYGNIQAKVNLATKGHTPYELLQNLSGKTYIHLTDGRIRGIDISPLLRHAQSTVVMLKETLAKRNSINVGAILTAELGEWRLQAMNHDQLVTPFRHLETNIIFNEGKAYTADFKLSHPEYTVNGHGIVDLLQQNVDYQALALLTHAKPHPSEQVSLFLQETPLAIQIKGSFDTLSIQPNLSRYADTAINPANKGAAEKTTDQTLEKLFGFPE
jgi:uncharacterized protein involved in outer membrane biogenesis